MQEGEEEQELRHLIEHMRLKGGSTSTREVCRSFQRLYPTAGDAEAALSKLVSMKIAHIDTHPTAGRSATVWALLAVDDRRQKPENHEENRPSVIAMPPFAGSALTTCTVPEACEWTA